MKKVYNERLSQEKKDLIRQYASKDKTIPDLARYLGLSQNTTRKYVTRNHLPYKVANEYGDGALKDLTPDVIKLTNEGIPVKYIAEQLKVSKPVVYSILKKLNLKPFKTKKGTLQQWEQKFNPVIDPLTITDLKELNLVDNITMVQLIKTSQDIAFLERVSRLPKDYSLELIENPYTPDEVLEAIIAHPKRDYQYKVNATEKLRLRELEKKVYPSIFNEPPKTKDTKTDSNDD